MAVTADSDFSSTSVDVAGTLRSFARGDAGWIDLERAHVHLVRFGDVGIVLDPASPVPFVRIAPWELAAGLLAHTAHNSELRDWAQVILSVFDLGDVALDPEGAELLEGLWSVADGAPLDPVTFLLARNLAQSRQAA